MINEDLRLEIANTNPQALLFDNPSYDNSIIGITSDDRAAYDYDLMIEELMQDDDISYDDAVDFISYNTIRSLSYINDENKPVIIYRRSYD